MLTELTIKNFAIIDEISLQFDEGFTVFTGETGAGKSIIIDAIQLLAGGRGSVEYVRHGANKAELDALFTVDDLHHPVYSVCEQLGIDIQDQMIILHRTITSQGKSICRVNGRLVTLTNLRAIGQVLIDIHSQHDMQILMDPKHHLSLLDAYAFDEIQPIKLKYQEIYKVFQQLQQRYETLSKNEQETSHRLDLLQFQQHELKEANLQANEDVQLDAERSHLVNFEKIYLNTETAYNALYGEQKGLEWLNKARMALENINSHDKKINKLLDTITNAYYSIEEITFELSHFRDNLHFDADRLNEIETRLDELARLKKKYGPTVNEMIEYQQKIAEEIDMLTHRDSHLNELEEEIRQTKQKLLDIGFDMHRARTKAAKRLTKGIKQELKDLFLEHATFKVAFSLSINDRDDISEQIKLHRDGFDQIHFLIATNRGEPLKPLHKVASGGELSRMMLALKSIFSNNQGVTSIIFDEVDTGVSGRVAQAMGEKIFSLSKNSQVLCITHLPQVAAMADYHKQIYKQVKEGRVTTSVRDLNRNEQMEALGTMITGAEITDSAISHGKKLLDLASSYKEKIS